MVYNVVMKLKNAIYIFKTLTSITSKLFNMFVPILIYQSTESVFMAVIYLLLSNLIRVVALLSFKKLQSKYPVYMLLSRFVPLLTLQILISLLSYYNWWIVIFFAVLNGIETAMLWPAINNLFALSAREEKAKSVSIYESFGSLGNILAPIVGAVMITLGLEVYNLVICTIINIVALVFVVLSIKEVNEKLENLPENNNDIKYDRKIFYVFHCFQGVQDFAIDQVLPLYMAINLISVNMIGLSYTLYQLCVVISNFLLIVVSKSKRWYVYSIISTITLSVLLVCLIFNTNQNMALAFTVCLGLLYPFVYSLMFSKMISKVDKNLIDDMTYREVCIISPKPITCSLLLFCPLSIALFIGSGSYLLNIISYLKQYKKELE